jgi:8-oxo-dGTP pyrophosphatase MutT (NUDIX family)
MEKLRSSDGLMPENAKHLVFQHHEPEAWRLAHQLKGEPTVLYIDAARASRFGTKFFRNSRTGKFHAHRVQVRDILNLLPKFAHQYSAGGIPLRWEGSTPMLLLCKVKRRSGVTWEVAKGKLEPCETPEQAAVREVQEEMGFTLPMTPKTHVGDIRYGFIAPGGLPRLKTVHMYLLESEESWDGIQFHPANAEGIIDVRWFSASDAFSVVKHSSLIPVMKDVRDILERKKIREPEPLPKEA